jgi:hypothetical protein
MRRQREQLFLKTQTLETRAAQSRTRFRQSVLAMATRPEGLAASFILGLTTQCSVADGQRKTLLNMASADFIGLCKSGFFAFVEPKPDPEQEKATQGRSTQAHADLSSDGNSMGL